MTRDIFSISFHQAPDRSTRGPFGKTEIRQSETERGRVQVPKPRKLGCVEGSRTPGPLQTTANVGLRIEDEP